MERDLEYENNNKGSNDQSIVTDEQYPEEEGGRIKCKNFELCEEVLPEWWFDCKNNYLCTNCHMMFGTWGENDGNIGKGVLEISDNKECPICLEIKKGISYPRCNHTACIDCFRRSFYGDQSGEPLFPYPEIEDEYFEHPNLNKWNNEYPLINIYNEEYNRWNDER